MSTSNVVTLPTTRKRSPSSELEAKVIGGVLFHGSGFNDFESFGLRAEDFSIDLLRLAFQIARRRAERREPVSPETVSSAGIRARVFTDDNVRQLEQLSLGNLLTKEALRHVATDLRLQANGQRLAAALDAEASRIRSGEFDPHRVAGYLDGLSMSLRRECDTGAPIGSDGISVLDKWESYEKTGKQRLIPTGIEVLDAMIGGLPPNTALIASAPGVGKTTFQDSAIWEQLNRDPNIRLGLFGLEDGTDHITRRWLARDMAIPLRDVLNKARTPEQRAQSESLVERYFPLLQRVQAFSQRKITPNQLFATAWRWVVDLGVSYIWVDNFAAIDLRNTGDRCDPYFERVIELADRAAEFSDRSGVGVGLLVHTTEQAEPGKPPVGTAAIQGGKALGRNTRLLLDLWQVNGALRCTINKANELCKTPVTLELNRIETAGLLTSDGGTVVDLKAERQAERRARAEQQDAERQARAKERKARAAAEKTAAEKTASAKEDPAQGTLLEVPSGPRAQ